MAQSRRRPTLAGTIAAALDGGPAEAFAYGVENRGRYHHTLGLLAGLGLGPASEILDAGVYPGHLAFALRHLLGASVTGAGFRFPGGFLESMQRAGVALTEVDLEREPLPGPAAAFDVAVATEILEHFWNPSFFLGEMLRLLRPGGHLVLSTPNLVDIRNRLRVLAGRAPMQHLFGIDRVFRMNEWVHRREYTPAEVRAMLEAAGFANVRTHTRTPTIGDGGKGPAALAAAALNLLPGCGGTVYAVGVKPVAGAGETSAAAIDRAVLSPAARTVTLGPGTSGALRITVFNAGSGAWQPGGLPGSVNLGAHLTDIDGRLLAPDYSRAPIPRALAPGDAAETTLAFVAPDKRGVYLIVADMVREGEHWFADDGSPPARIVLNVD